MLSELSLAALQVDMNFMKKIPPGAEASNVLVGEVDFLEKPIIAFVRLSPAVLITGLPGVPVPTRLAPPPEPRANHRVGTEAGPCSDGNIHV